jgi:hypothetical protein
MNWTDGDHSQIELVVLIIHAYKSIIDKIKTNADQNITTCKFVSLLLIHI